MMTESNQMEGAKKSCDEKIAELKARLETARTEYRNLEKETAKAIRERDDYIDSLEKQLASVYREIAVRFLRGDFTNDK